MNTSKYKHKNVQPQTQNANIDEHQEVLEFKYLGSLVTYDKYCGKDKIYIKTHETKNMYYSD